MYADAAAIFAQAMTKEQATSKLLPLFKDKKQQAVVSTLPTMTRKQINTINSPFKLYIHYIRNCLSPIMSHLK